jgi:predicted site-specific integrase-resolvase
MRESDELIIGSAEAAEIFGVSVATVNRWAASGKLKPLRKLPGETVGWVFDARLVRRKATERLLARAG